MNLPVWCGFELLSPYIHVFKSLHELGVFLE
jgi:hypothetical protein